MRTSQTIAALAPAFAAAQGALQAPKKDGSGNFGAYVLLGDVLVDVRAVLSAHKLAVVQSVLDGDLVTTILHASGEWIATDYPLARDGNPQRQGSALTYARRYALLAALGLAGVDSDDDGAAASSAEADRARKAKKDTARKSEHHASWEADRARFCAGLPAGVTLDQVGAYCEAHERGRPSTMPQAQRVALSSWLATDDGRVRVAEWLAVQP